MLLPLLSYFSALHSLSPCWSPPSGSPTPLDLLLTLGYFLLLFSLLHKEQCCTYLFIQVVFNIFQCYFPNHEETSVPCLNLCSPVFAEPLVDLLHQETEIMLNATGLSINCQWPVYFPVCSVTLLSSLDFICHCASYFSTGRILYRHFQPLLSSELCVKCKYCC